MKVQNLSYEDLDAGLVQAIDPLAADAACIDLRAMNAHSDSRALISALRAILPDATQLKCFSPHECLAAMRDIGLFLGSIKRHGIEPAEAVPEVEPVLLYLAHRTDMVPRDTIHHYISWNPEGPRARTYTDDPMEVRAMSAVRISLPRLRSAIGLCQRLSQTDIDDPQFPCLIQDLADELSVLEEAIDIVVQHVTAAFFARTMRPYFEEIRLNGNGYLGPAAAHVPLSLIDLALWASDQPGSAYEHFWQESAQYSLPMWRALYPAWSSQPSLSSRLAAAWAGEPTPIQAAPAIAAALARALRSLVVFRGRHLHVARQAYAEEVRLYSLGSGGGSIDLLAEVLLFTRENAALVGALHRRRDPPGQPGCARQLDTAASGTG